MTTDLEQTVNLLERTPKVIEAMLEGLPDACIYATEGEGTWSPFDIVGHLVHGEKTDWIPRLEIILSTAEDRRFVKFDRFAQFEESKGKSLLQLLEEFAVLRETSLRRLREKRLTSTDMVRTAIHPEFGEVTAAQLLATWAAHDLDHVSQIARVLAKQYYHEVGPWLAYLRILRT